MMFDAITLGSSHTDSMKKIWAQKAKAVKLAALKWKKCCESSGSITDLEAVVTSKLEDHLSPVSGRVSGVKDLKGHKAG